MRRDDLLAALQARLNQVASGRNLAPALEPGAVDEARQLIEQLHDGDGDIQARYVLGWLHWYRYAGLPEPQSALDLNVAIAMFTSCYITDTGEVPSALWPILAEEAITAAMAIQNSLESADEELCSIATALWQRILNDLPDDHPGRAGMLSNLGIAQRARFKLTGDLAHLEAAIEAGRAAAQISTLDNLDRAQVLSNLAAALGARFERTTDLADLDAAIDARRSAAGTVPGDHPDRVKMLVSLWSALAARFGQTSTLADLDEAIEAIRAAATAAPAGDPGRAIMFSHLGAALRNRFERTGTQSDLAEAVEAGKASVALASADPASRPVTISTLGVTLLVRFGQLGDPADLEAAVNAAHEAVAATRPDDPNRAGMLTRLGVALIARYTHAGLLTDLDQAVFATRAAVETIAPHDPDLAAVLCNHRDALQERFERIGGLADLDEAIETGRAGLAATPPSALERAARLSRLGVSLQARFRKTGALADLDAAVEMGRAAVQATPADDLRRSGHLSCFGNALRARFERTGVLADLDEAVEIGRAAVAAADNSERARCLSNLGNALGTRFHRTELLTDLDEAVDTIRMAAGSTVGRELSRAGYQNNLGLALRIRFERTGVQADLDEAVEAGRKAVASLPVDDPHWAVFLSNLGVTLSERFRQTGRMADLDEAVEAGRKAVAVASPGHARAAVLSNLGSALAARYRQNGDLADRDEAAATFAAGAQIESDAPSDRIRAARAAADLLSRSDPDQAARLLEAAVRLLGEVAPRQLKRTDQQYAIGGFAGLASDAAALTLAAGDAHHPDQRTATKALRLLEAGRAILLSQALELRDELSDLRLADKELANRFTYLRGMLDQSGSQDNLAGLIDDVDFGEDAAPDWTPEGRLRLATQLAETLAQIRARDGFASFGLPPTSAQLLAEAAAGPIVTFNVGVYRSDALLLTADGVSAVELPALTRNILARQVDDFHQALEDATHAGFSSATAQKKLTEILEWLWDTAAGPVLDALGYDGKTSPDVSLPRVWWSPGGLLGMLPIHAAGYHAGSLPGEQQPVRTVLDRVVSSYTPIISALRFARQHARYSTGTSRALIVAMPVTPDFTGSELPKIQTEVARLQIILPDHVALIEPDTAVAARADETSAIPSLANVFRHLPACSIAHFACHGTSHPSDPSKSRLLLHDHKTSPLTVASLSLVSHDHLELVYLSACHTAFTRAMNLQDEAIHLTSAFQLAGSRHVIGTLWEINDTFAADVAAAFYSRLRTETGTLDTDLAATALHQVTRRARDVRPHSPSLWAAYIHVGA